MEFNENVENIVGFKFSDFREFNELFNYSIVCFHSSVVQPNIKFFLVKL